MGRAYAMRQAQVRKQKEISFRVCVLYMVYHVQVTTDVSLP